MIIDYNQMINQVITCMRSKAFDVGTSLREAIYRFENPADLHQVAYQMQSAVDRQAVVQRVQISAKLTFEKLERVDSGHLHWLRGGLLRIAGTD